MTASGESDENGSESRADTKEATNKKKQLKTDGVKAKPHFCDIFGQDGAEIRPDHVISIIDSARQSGLSLPQEMEAEVVKI